MSRDHDEAQAHALLLQVQQQITLLEQPLEQALDRAAGVACQLAGGQAALIELREGRQLRVAACTGPAPLPAVGSLRALDTHPLWQRLLDAPAHVLGDSGGRAFVAAPLVANGQLVGLLQVLAPPGQAFAPPRLEHLHILAESLAAMLELRRVDARLRASEHQYQALFSGHAQPMWVCEQGSLRLLAVNHAMARHYGYAEESLLAMDMAALWPPARRADVPDAVDRAGRTRAPTLWRHQRRSGAPIDVEVVLGPTTFDGRAAWQVLASDVTERCRMEDELARVNRARRMRSACSQVLVRATSEDELLHAICRVAVDMGGYALGWVGMVRSDAARSIDIVARAGQHAQHLEQLRLSWSHTHEAGRGPAGKAVRSGQTVIVRDLGADGQAHPRTAELAHLGFAAMVCLPLKSEDHTFGLLYLYAPEVLHIGTEETQLLEALAADLAFGIQGLRARAEQQRLQSALLQVASAVSAGMGTQFFDQLAGNMAKALGARIACVARFVPVPEGQPTRAVTLSYVHQDQVQPPGEYLLEGTPSEQLLVHRQFVVADRAAELYPRAPILALAHARSYVGQQLTDSRGRALGILFVAFTRALEQAQFVVHMLQIFAARATAELERQEADAHILRQASLLDKAGDAILVRDLEHRITYWNHGAERMYGWRGEEALGQRITTLLYRDQAQFERAMEVLMREGSWSGELIHYDRQGQALEAEGRWTLVRDEQGRPQSVLAINTDIRQRKASEREIQRLAFFDPLTGLPNRLQLLERMGDALALAQRQGSGGALLFIDLDNFKTLNDTLGHDKGDQLLQIVAQRLSGCVRPTDTVARLGGDEFVVLVQALSGQGEPRCQAARQMGEKVLAALGAPYALAGYQVRSTPSVGIALFGPGPATTVGELLKQADMAMYEAKTAGRNTLRFFDPAMQEAVAERAQLEADLREALAQGEFLLVYQPVVDVCGHILGVEALARWAHPQRGMVSPAAFIPLAEETGLILPLGRWVLHTACAQLADWKDRAGWEHLTMAVNVSSRQFRDAGFVQEVVQALAQTGAPADRLKLELTESLLVEDMQATIATMEALRAHGVGFSLDDFGTGYSSLAYLKRMPLAQLKIDQSFVRDLLQDASDAAIVRTIIALASSLDLQAIAEGVETMEQRDWLASAGCTLFQGYLFSRPLPADQLEQWLQGRLATPAR
ncbi:EAL domain-containing protein [Pulveribacter sp.]|uniref:EAL domain-containing protein n=1 Tax=Pulveribacter sp. TaxID=2678893 RepID=UPI0028AF7E89|nr:EAL domain-containing protein [Pulveribacter sp.]